MFFGIKLVPKNTNRVLRLFSLPNLKLVKKKLSSWQKKSRFFALG
jgi:hypothetical protein